MSEDYRVQIEQIIDRIWEADGGAAAAAQLYESAIHLADAHGDKELGFELRNNASHQFSEAGLFDRQLVHMAWRLARCDEDPEKFPVEQLLWTYKWVIQDLFHFASLSRERIAALTDDFTRRMKLRGEGERTSSYIRMCTLLGQNHLDEAHEELSRWPVIDRDAWSDCRACEANEHVLLLARLKRDEEAFVAAEPLLKKKLTCAEVPQYTYAHLLLPALRLGRFQDAANLYTKSFASLLQMEKSHGRLGDLLAFLAISHNTQPAIRLIEERLGAAMTLPSQIDRLHFYAGCELVMQRLPDEPLRLNLPAEHPLHRDEGTYPPRELGRWFGEESAKLIAAFDRRNGNTYLADWHAELLRLFDSTPPIALPEMKSRRRRPRTE